MNARLISCSVGILVFTTALSLSAPLAWAGRGTEVLKNVDLRARAAWLDSLRDYEFTAEVSLGVPGVDMVFSISHKALAPDCFVTKHTIMGLEKTFICDGDSLWTVMPGLGTYSVEPWTSVAVHDWQKDVIGNLIKNPPYPFKVLEYLVAPTLNGSYAYSGDDRLVINGRESSCEIYTIVQDTRDNLSDRLWIDPRLHIVEKIEGSAEQTPGVNARFGFRLKSLVLNRGLTAADFRFEAPPGYRRVTSAAKLLVSDSLEGTTPPDLVLRDLAGQSVPTSDWRGKVVVLDFWATWCAPCRKSLPHLSKLADEFGDQVLFVGVTGEDRATVERFLVDNPSSYPILLDPDQQAAREFRVTNYPTLFVLDRQGKILEQFVGYQPEDVLRQAIGGVLDRSRPRGGALTLKNPG